MEESLIAGRWSDRGHWGLELSWSKAVVGHVEPSEAYLQSYPDARGGWYGAPAGLIRVGPQGGLRRGSVEWTIQAGLTVSDRGHQATLPVVLATGVAYAW